MLKLRNILLTLFFDDFAKILAVVLCIVIFFVYAIFEINEQESQKPATKIVECLEETVVKTGDKVECVILENK